MSRDGPGVTGTYDQLVIRGRLNRATGADQTPDDSIQVNYLLFAIIYNGDMTPLIVFDVDAVGRCIVDVATDYARSPG